MGEGTRIQWATHTFNPWRGCAKVTPGCDNCYAEAGSKRNPRLLGTWGPDGVRAMASESYWRKPLAWNERAAVAGERHRVFCASLADVFEDRPDLVEPRARLFALITATPALDWLLLTKRPASARAMLTDRGRGSLVERMDEIRGAAAGDFAWPLPNVWLGTTVEDQARADERVPILLDTPAAVRFLSCEPLLGPVDLTNLSVATTTGVDQWDALDRVEAGDAGTPGAVIDWLIIGGESGPSARPMDLGWARSLVEQGRAAGVAVFVKQLGRRPVDELGSEWTHLRDSHGGDPAEWPLDLRVRELPGARS